MAAVGRQRRASLEQRHILIEQMKLDAPRGQDVRSLAAKAIERQWTDRLLAKGFSPADIKDMADAATRNNPRVSKPRRLSDLSAEELLLQRPRPPPPSRLIPR